jgi:myo-inositol 2-dehydrogenase/D-chiro-inositol 1-dehydrogenase
VRDPQLVLFETDGGVLADVETFLRARYGYQVRCEVVGETGSLSLPAPAVLRVAREGCDSLVLQDGFDRFAQAFRHEIQAWVDSVRDAQPVGPDAWDGYAASAVIEASVRAAATRQRIEVALEPRPPMRSSLFEDA